jgi:triacylglycerol lipase
VHDAWETVLWVVSGAAEAYLRPYLGLNIGVSGDSGALDLKRLAIGGSSAGGNLAAVMTQRALHHSTFLEKGTAFMYQILVVPVTDNTASVTTNATYTAYEHTPALPAEKMLWYRRHYLPNETDWSDPLASPLLASEETFASLPKALVVVAGLDVLRREGEEYARRLNDAGAQAEVVVVEGVPHPFLVMDAVLKKGRDAVSLLCKRLAEAFE